MVVHLTIGSKFKTYNDFGFIALEIVGDNLNETPGVLWLPGLVGCTKKSRMTCGGARRNFSKAGDFRGGLSVGFGDCYYYHDQSLPVVHLLNKQL